jgi:predicted ATPase
MSKNPKWHVLTGAPSSGKTTTLDALAALGYKTVPEMARVYIEEELATGKTLASLATDSPKFEEDVLEMKINLEKSLPPNVLTFLDRGMHDTLAYYDLYGWKKGKRLLQACREARYQTIFLLEMLDYVDDGVRVESEANARQLEKLFLKVYQDAGYKVVIIPRGAVENRVQKILEHIT